MTPRLVGVLGVAAALSAGLAAAAWMGNNPAVSSAVGAGERLLPGLVEQANAVAEITVTSASGAITARRADGRWVLAESGYPADPEKIGRLIVQLAQLTRLEPKTDNPEKYALLQVEAPDREGARSRLVTLKGADGGVLAEAILGKPAAGRVGGGREAQYARLPSEPASWLVQGAADPKPEFGAFADTRLLTLAGGDIRSATFRKPGEETPVEIRKAEPAADGQAQYEVANLPEGGKLRNAADARHAATDLARVDILDARPRKDGVTPAAEVEAETESGMKLRFRLVEEVGKPWLSIDVLEPGSDQAAADALAAKADGWEFAVSDHKARQFRKSLADLVEGP